MRTTGWLAAVAIMMASITTGCGPSAPPRPEADVQKSAAAHDELSKNVAAQYKGGKPRGHGK